jgi:hypothetical protein
MLGIDERLVSETGAAGWSGPVGEAVKRQKRPGQQLMDDGREDR